MVISLEILQPWTHGQGLNQHVKVGSSCVRIFPFSCPNFEKVGSILVLACPFVPVSICPFKKKLKLEF